MSNNSFGVGIIGVQPGRSWAAVAHIPALEALDEFHVAALSTTRMESAKAAGEAFGVANVYDNHAALIADPGVDIVAVTVKVPHHRELVMAALAAGKKVYCEWPLGNGTEEAEEMADTARSAGIACAVGMQARSAPVVAYVRQLVRDGFVGEVLSTTLIGSGMAWGAFTNNPNAYTNDKSNGATMLSIPVGHSMEALCHCLGEMTEVSATIANRRPQITNADTGMQIAKTGEDQIAFSGLLEGGAVVNVHYRGGVCKGTELLWEINGTDGDLQITSFGGHMQIFDLELRGAKAGDEAMAAMAVPQECRWVPAALQGPAVNMAQAYARFADDIRTGSRTCPDFDDAVRRHRMLDAIERSAMLGIKEKIV